MTQIIAPLPNSPSRWYTAPKFANAEASSCPACTFRIREIDRSRNEAALRKSSGWNAREYAHCRSQRM